MPNENQQKQGFSIVRIIIVFSIIFVILSIIIGGYHTGFFSFAQRIVNTSLCKNKETPYCIKLNYSFRESIYSDEELANEKGKRAIEYLYTSNSVFLSMNNNSLWTWSPHQVFKQYKINDRTTYEVYITVSNSENNGENNIEKYVNEGVLTKINLSKFTGFTNVQDMSIVRSNQPLSLQEFEKIIKGGNLVKIIYDKNTNTIVNIILVNATRI